MTHPLKFFVQDQDGAITVDWVVLTAAIVGLAVAAAASGMTGVRTLGGTISTSVATKTVSNGN
jgi:Flp pilus assembly pilin Flp